MASGTIKKPFETYPTMYAKTYTSNSVASELSFNRCDCVRLNNTATLFLNLNVNSVTTSDFVEIGRFTGLKPYLAVLATIPIQRTTENCTVMISTSGVVTVYKPVSATGFARGTLTFPLESIS